MIKPLGIFKTINRDNRLVMPMAIIRKFGLLAGTPIAISIDGKQIILEKIKGKTSEVVVRKIDDVGRVPIPKSVLKAVGYHKDILYEMFIDEVNERLVLKEYIPGCVICGGNGTYVIKEKCLCMDCIEEIKKTVLMA